MSGDGRTKVQWTEAQLRGIRTTGRSLLVSAAAGSGKTAVLAQRCAYLVCDAEPPCDVDQLLVVTFTEAAAAEMKGRIEGVLRERLAGAAGPGMAGMTTPAEEDPRLARQLALIERAQVSTLHGFCSRLLRQHFHLLGLDPGFSMLDGDEGALLRIDVARELFAERYEADADGTFGRLVRFFAAGDDEGLVPHVLRTHELLGSVIDPAGWIAKARRRIDEAATGRLEDSEAGRELVKLVTDKLAGLRKRCDDAIAAVGRAEGLEKYVAYLQVIGAVLDEWGDRLRVHGLDVLSAAVKELALPKLPSVKADTPGKEVAVAAIDSVRDEMKEGALAEIARFSRAEWQAGLRSVGPLANCLLDLVEEFGVRYRRAKDAARRLDFNDLERFALRVLREESAEGLRPSGVARGYHRQFEHVLVDEYQDINEVQDAILRLVSRECVAGEGAVQNLFCVGDVKQSIYRFRLAEPERFLRRYEAFKGAGTFVRAAVGDLPSPQPSPTSGGAGSAKDAASRSRERGPEGAAARPLGEVIDLQANFRSRGPLLEVLNQLFVRLMTAEATDVEYDESHFLRAGATYPAGDGTGFSGAPVELHILPQDVPAGGAEDEEELDRSEREAQFVARRVRELMGLGGSPRASVVEKGVVRPIEYRDIVVLLRSMRVKADQYADTLRAAGVPVHRDGGQGYFGSMEVRDVRALLTLLDNPQQDIPMAAVLRSPIAGIADAEDCLARVRLAYPARGASMVNGPLSIAEARDAAANPQLTMGHGQLTAIPFHRAVVRYAEEQRDELAAALRDFLGQLRRWRQLARQRPLAELIWEVYDQTGYLAFCEGLTNGAQRVANLVYLHERATQFGSFSRQGLYRFLKFLDSLEAETDFGQPSVLSESADVVRVMSVHRSKGLEFPVVFLPELGKRINLADCQGAILIDKRAGLGMSAVDEGKRIRYPSLASVLVQQSLRRQSLAEELRVLYVAATRAKEHLILSGTCSAKKCEQWSTRWPGHVGAMPAEDVLAAGCMLDWVGPVVQMIGGEAAFVVTNHSPEEVGGWTAGDLKRPGLSAEQERMARLEPLSPAPAMDARAAKLIESLTVVYPYAAAAKLEAARSVTDWTKRRVLPTADCELPIDEGGGASASSNPQFAIGNRQSSQSFDRTLETPKCLLAKNQLSAADVGSATHVVLQHLDLARPCVEDDLALQINDLVSRRLITKAQAKHVDLPAIEWFVGTPLARRMAGAGEGLRRELDFYLAVGPDEFPGGVASDDPRDQIMIRGRIDAMLIEDGGLTVIDYKTDHVTAETIGGRVASYAPQVNLYRRAMGRISPLPVVAVQLVFLTARRVVVV